MKLLHATILLLSLFLFSCGKDVEDPAREDPNNSSDANETSEPNLDDPQVREKILSEAVGELRYPGGGLYGYAPGQQTPYTGWVGGRHPNGKAAALWYAKDGVKGGLWVAWYDNGQRRIENRYKNGGPVGLSITWNKDGTEAGRHIYPDGNQSVP